MRPSEYQFQAGLLALQAGRFLEAAGKFESALLLERSNGAKQPPMIYLSYYGYSMARAEDRPSPESIRACETAARREFMSPELQLNLGRVYALAGKVSRALAAFEKGLRLNPKHRALREELRRFDRRGRPPVGFLSRNHPLNRWMGRMRSRRQAESM